MFVFLAVLCVAERATLKGDSNGNLVASVAEDASLVIQQGSTRIDVGLPKNNPTENLHEDTDGPPHLPPNTTRQRPLEAPHLCDACVYAN